MSYGVNVYFTSIFKNDTTQLNIKYNNKYGMGNNPMVGATVAVAVSVEEAAKAGKF